MSDKPFSTPNDLQLSPAERQGKSPLASKKFTAMLLSEITLKVLIGGGIWIFSSDDNLSLFECLTLMTLVATSGFVVVGYVLGQAYVDRYADLGFFDVLKKT
jgi:hypothetical protein